MNSQFNNQNANHNVVGFTINARLTLYCNADCTYCCSERGYKKLQYISPSEFGRCIDAIISYWEHTSKVRPTHVTIQYLGGEISLIPVADLQAIVHQTRNQLTAKGVEVKDGLQTHLLGPKHKLEHLHHLFDGRLATTVDNHTSHRKISGSSARYQALFKQNDEYFNLHHQRLPAVVVLDDNSASFIHDELILANRQHRPLTIRPIYMGRLAVALPTTKTLNRVLTTLFDDWFLKMGILVEPFLTLVKKRLVDHSPDYQHSGSLNGCHHCNDCARRSISIEPNGDLYLCTELADAGYGFLGNALTGNINTEQWNRLDARRCNLPEECFQCDYYTACQGGCMADSLLYHQDLYGKSPTCEAWKQIFGKIDKAIQERSISDVMRWVRLIEDRSIMSALGAA